MRWPLIVLLLLAGSVQAETLSGKVVGIADGDTLTVLVEGQQYRIRLIDIDAPELGQAFGKRSKDSLAQLCAARPAKVVWGSRDRYQRLLGRVSCADVDANAEQIRRGFAWVFMKYAPKDSPLYHIEADARVNGRGLWKDPHPVAPWQWRAAQNNR